MNEFNGTNPILEALGDEPTIRDITINNNTSFKIVEPLTGLEIKTETVVRVHGEVAFQQIQNNIVQLNELKQQEAVNSTGQVIDPLAAAWDLTNCAVENDFIAYTGGLIEKEGVFPVQSIPALFAAKDFDVGEELLFTVMPSTCNKLIIAFDMGTRSGEWSDGSAVVQERPEINKIQLFDGRTPPQANIDTTLFTDAYLISMKLTSNTRAILTIKDANTEQELASLVVNNTQLPIGSFSRLWIYAEFETSESQFSIPFTVPNHNQSQ